MSQQLLLAQTEQKLFEGSSANRLLHALVQEIKHKQKAIDVAHEMLFRDIVVNHQHDSFISPKCCENIKNKGDRQKQLIRKTDEIIVDPIQPYLSRINNYSIPGGSHLHFELSHDPTELIGAIFWQLKRIKIEKYEPVVIGAANESKDQEVSKTTERVDAEM